MTEILASGPVDQSWALAQTIHRLFQCIDDGQMDQAANLFIADGCWTRMGEKLVGPQGVLRALLERPAGLRTRHLVTNMVIRLGAEMSHARYYATVFDHHGTPDAVGVMQLPHFLFVCDDELIQTRHGWRFSRRHPRMVAKRQ